MTDQQKPAKLVTLANGEGRREWQVRLTTMQLMLSIFIMSLTATGMVAAGAMTLLRPVVKGWVEAETEAIQKAVTELPGVYYTRREFENYESEQIFRMNSIASSVNKIEGRVEWLYQQEIAQPRGRQ